MTCERRLVPLFTGPSPYRGRRVALLTRHGKERVIAPVLEPAIGCRIELVEGFDTDRLGTFTREIPRAGTQREAARKKARIGMELANLPHGLASEGSFGPDPIAGMFSWNVEFVIFLDAERGLEVVGVAQGKANHGHLLTGDWTVAEAFARQAEFPAHHLVVRPEGENDPRIRKGIAHWAELEASFAWAQTQSVNGLAFLETDVRAHVNPTRQSTIRAAAEDLAAKLLSPCPVCRAPGFWIVDRVPGLPCSECGAPTRETRADILGCVRCPHQITRLRGDRREADPGRCDYCNP
ncbi:DUF6671 family protein [Thioalkalicoccus limnaeus]|uniref:DUF6671 family protein n=1 Tax=Thioalkalicoccus limnaeus TaxID=120681 RepID=A0ABV4BFH6_9GAMM